MERKSSSSSSDEDCLVLQKSRYPHFDHSKLEDNTRHRDNSTEGGGQLLSQWFFKLLVDLGLHKYYPGKLSKKDLIKIFPSDIDDVEDKFKGFRFLRKVLFVNVQSREVFEEGEENLYDPDEDIEVETSSTEDGQAECRYHVAIMAIFMCADPFLRKYLVEKMQMCQFAVPFILPLTKEVMLWPMRIVRSWTAENQEFTEQSLASAAMPMLSVMKLGKLDSSIPSEMLNFIFREPGYKGFHSDGDEGQTSISHGLVEIAWYLPRGRHSDPITKAFAATYLHGEAGESPQQVDLLLKMSSCVIIITESVDIAEEFLSEHTTCKSVILALYRTSKKNPQQTDRKSSHIVIQLNRPEDIVKYIKVIRSNLKMPSQSLEERLQLVLDGHFQVDEEQDDCIKGKERAAKVMENIHDNGNLALPFQKAWKMWLNKGKEVKRGDVESKSQAKDRQESQESLSWDSQSACVKEFLVYLQNMRGRQLLFFLEWLNMFLNDKSRQVVDKLQSNVDTSQSSNVILSNMREGLEKNSLGLEHFFRELGMLWTLTVKRDGLSSGKVHWLPHIAALLLLEGYPLEILNGDALHVPTDWIKQVFSFLNKFTGGTAKILVTSIIGIQSSGKSTFLNTMFGINFAVGSGRCTKGVYMQLVKVDHETQERLGCEYIVVIDTEGLNSAEQIGHDNIRDKKMATFAVGIADVTFINIGGENDDSMRDILQVICHAFLRMTALSKNKPKCIMVHQNVADLAASSAATTGKMKFFNTLNEMTKLAAEAEGCENKFQKFSDIIDYDPSEMDFYVPGLWQRSPPMASVNIDYSEAAENVKRSFLKEVQPMNVDSLMDFSTRIERVFKAVEKDKFLDNLQSAAATKAVRNLAEFFETEKFKERLKLLGWITTIEHEIKHSRDVCTSGKKMEIMKDSNKVIEKYIASLEDMMDSYYSQHQEVSVLLRRSRPAFQEDIFFTKKDLTSEVQRGIEDMFCRLRMEDKSSQIVKKVEKDLKGITQGLQTKHKDTNDSSSATQTITEDFEKQWSRVMGDVKQPRFEGVDVGATMTRCLQKRLKELSLDSNPKRHKKLTYEVTEDDIVLTQKDVFNEDVKNTAQSQANKILEAVQQKLYRMTEVPRMFSEDFGDKLVLFSIELIEKTPENDFRFTETFKAGMLQVICQYAAAKFLKMHDTYVRSLDPIKVLEKKKSCYLDLVLPSVHQRKDYVRLFTEELVWELHYGLKDRLVLHLRKQLSPDNLNLPNRSHMEFLTLLDLQNQNDVRLFLDFIHDYKGFTSSWLLGRACYWLRAKDGDDTRFANIVRNLVDHVLVKLKVALEKYAEIKIEYAEFVTDLRKFMRNGLRMHMDDGCFERLKILPVRDLSALLRGLRNQQRRMASMLIEKYLRRDIRTRIKQISPPIEEDLFKTLTSGCNSQCPFCLAPCSVIGPHQLHEPAMHRPLGLVGRKNTRSRTLVFQDCEDLVEKEREEMETQLRSRAHCDTLSRLEKSNWNVEPSDDRTGKTYWKLVLMVHNEQLAAYYLAKPASISQRVRELRWPLERKDLRSQIQPWIWEED